MVLEIPRARNERQPWGLLHKSMSVNSVLAMPPHGPGTGRLFPPWYGVETARFRRVPSDVNNKNKSEWLKPLPHGEHRAQGRQTTTGQAHGWPSKTPDSKLCRFSPNFGEKKKKRLELGEKRIKIPVFEGRDVNPLHPSPL